LWSNSNTEFESPPLWAPYVPLEEEIKVLEYQIHVESVTMTTPQCFPFRATANDVFGYGDTQTESIGVLIEQLVLLGQPFVITGITYE
jgi:hypothetical protein